LRRTKASALASGIQKSEVPKINVLIWWLTAGGCALFAVDDVSNLRSLGGGLLASPSWIPILLAGWIASRSSQFRDMRHRGLLSALFMYGGIVTLFTLPFLTNEILGENPLIKGFKLMVSVGVFLLMLVAGGLLSRIVPKAIQFGCFVAIGLMTGGALMYHFGTPAIDQTELLHSYSNFQQRVRSTRFEASSLGSGLLVCMGLVFLFFRNKKAILGYCLGLLCIGMLAESRGTTLTVIVTLITVLIALWLRLLLRTTNDSVLRFWTFAVAVVAIVLSFRLDYFLESPIWSAVGLQTEGTSDASRSMWADTSLAAVVQYPFGMGYAAYLEWLPAIVEQSTRTALDQFPIRDLAEMINQSLAASDATLSPKNLVGVAAVHLGVVGVAAIGLLYATVLRNSMDEFRFGNINRFVIAVSIMVLTSSYYSSIFSVDQAFLFGALVWWDGRIGNRRDGESDSGLRRFRMSNYYLLTRR
jgi:hypothetical protein